MGEFYVGDPHTRLAGTPSNPLVGGRLKKECFYLTDVRLLNLRG
jgi:hypothetical protein